MSQNEHPKQLFDYYLSGTKDDSWRNKITLQAGCEVLVSNAGAQLEAMVDQFSPEEQGWYVLLMEIEGFNGGEWIKKVETLKTLVEPLAPTDSRTWIYLLGGTKLAVLVRSLNKTLLVGFVQKLAASLVVGQGSPRTRMVEIPAQKQVVKDYLASHALAKSEAIRQQQAEETAQRLASISFELLESTRIQRQTRSRPVILVVEDDPVTVQVLEHLLSQLRTVDILTARNAADAAVLYRRNAPDIVFLDIGLPEISGLTLLAKLREADSEACVVILTANAYRSNLDKATELGATGFLAKPFTPAKISQVVQQLMMKKGIGK